MLREVGIGPSQPLNRGEVRPIDPSAPHELVKKWHDYLKALAVVDQRRSNYLPGHRSYQEYVDGGDTYLQAALEEEAAHGIGAATELLEIARSHYLGAVGRGEEPSPVDNEPSELDPLLLVRLASCQAKLAGAPEIHPYQSEESQGRNRREDLFLAALKNYKVALERAGGMVEADEEILLTILSGRAHAYTLRGQYLEKTGHPLDADEDFDTAMEQLSFLKRELHTGEFLAVVDAQQQEVEVIKETASLGSHDLARPDEILQGIIEAPAMSPATIRRIARRAIESY